MPQVLLQNYKFLGEIKCGEGGPPVAIGDSVRLFLNVPANPDFPVSVDAKVISVNSTSQVIGPCRRVVTLYTFEYDSTVAGAILTQSDILLAECISAYEILEGQIEGIEQILGQGPVQSINGQTGIVVIQALPLRTVYLSSSIPSDTDLRGEATTTGVDRHVALQAIFDLSEAGPLHVVVDVACTGYADIGDNTTVDILGGCGIKLPDGANRPLFRNKRWNALTIPAPANSGEVAAYKAFIAAIVKNKNITIQGDGVLHYNAINQEHHTANGGWVVGMRFFNVENLTIKGNIKHLRPKTFTIETGNTLNLSIDASNFNVGPSGGVNMDGIHTHGPAKNITIRNCSGFCDDDITSITADDGISLITSPSFTYTPHGDISGVLIEGFDLQASLFAFRLLSGSSLLDDVTILNTRGSFNKAAIVADYLPEEETMGVSGGGNFGSIRVEDWYARPINMAVFKQSMFFIGGTHRRWTFRNIQRHDLTANNATCPTWLVQKDHPENPLSNSNLDYIDIDGYSFSKPSTGGFQHQQIHLHFDGSNTKRASIRNTVIDTASSETIAGFLVAVTNSSVVDSLEIDGINSNGTLGGLVVKDSTSTIGKLVLKNINEPMFSAGAIDVAGSPLTISPMNPQDFSLQNFNHPGPGFGDAIYRLGDVLSPDVSISGIFSIDVFGTIFLGAREPGFGFRAAKTGYNFQMSATSVSIHLSDTDEVLDTVAFSPVANAEYFMCFECKGTSLKGYVRSVETDLWLSGAGAWQQAKTPCCTATDSTKTGKNVWVACLQDVLLPLVTLSCRDVQVREI